MAYQSLRLRTFFSANSSLAALLLHNGDAAHTQDVNFAYFAGGEVDSSFFLAARGQKPVIITPEMNRTAAQATGLRVVSYRSGQLNERLAKELKGITKLGLNLSLLDSHNFLRLRKLGVTAVDVSGPLEAARAVKEPAEIAAIRKAVRLTRKIIDGLALRPGKTELELATALRSATISVGADDAFRPIVAAGANSALPHAFAGNRRLRAGEPLLMDYGAKIEGYCADVTRVKFQGRADGARERYEQLKNVHDQLLDEIAPGVKIADFVATGNKLMARAGLPPMIHSFGHGIGLEVHEAPGLGKSSREVFRAGQVVALEPGAYWPGKYGLRHENTLLITKKGAEVL